MRLYDTSYYYKDETIEHYMVEVLPVNKSVWITFNVAKGFNLVLNSSNLRYKKVSDEAGLIELPDGIYEIKQSYKPNIQTLHHFYHFRTVTLMRKIHAEMRDLINNKCNLERFEYMVNRDKLRDIEEYALAAKWAVEECTDKKKGKELYEWAEKALEQYTNECQC